MMKFLLMMLLAVLPTTVRAQSGLWEITMPRHNDRTGIDSEVTGGVGDVLGITVACVKNVVGGVDVSLHAMTTALNDGVVVELRADNGPWVTSHGRADSWNAVRLNNDVLNLLKNVKKKLELRTTSSTGKPLSQTLLATPSTVSGFHDFTVRCHI